MCPLILRSAAEQRVSKDGDREARSGASPFETHRSAMLLRVRCERNAQTPVSTGSPASAGDDNRDVLRVHRTYSNFWMRSPSSPRGRISSTSAISRYIEASPQDGLK